MAEAVVSGLNPAACRGPDTTTEVINQPTLGQPLEERDRASKRGAITRDGYEKTKKGTLEKAARAEHR